MLIKGSAKIRGVVEIPSIKQQLKAGQSVIIKDNDFWNTDIQMAIRGGYIESVGDPVKSDIPSERKVVCRNNYIRAINIPGEQNIYPGATFTILESQLHTPEIRNAVSKGKIIIVESENSVPVSEATIKISSHETSEVPSVMTDVNDELPLGTIVDDPIAPNSVTFNPTSKKPITTIKGAVTSNKPDATKLAHAQTKIPVHISDTVTPEPVQSNDGDPRQNTIVVNPSGDPITNTIKHATIWDGNRAAQNEEISFVDQEQAEQRRANHPKIGKQPPPEDNKPEMIDLEKATKKPHPKLDKRKSKQDQADAVEPNGVNA